MGEVERTGLYHNDGHRNMRTPARKSDQWHRLAAVVSSSQKTFVTNSPQSEKLARAKMPGNIPKGVTLPVERKTAFRRSLSTNFAPNANFENSPSKIRSLSKRYDSQAHDIRNCGQSSKRFKADFSDSDVGRMSSNHRRRTHDGCYINRARSSKLSKFNEVSLESMSDPHSQKYLCSFMCLAVIVAMVMMLLTNGAGLNLSRSKPVTRSLTRDDIHLLEKKLREEVFGQHIARKVVLDMMKTVTAVDHETRQGGVKMAVLSLHGWTGVGKTFLSQLVLDSLNPENFIRYIIPIHFPHSLDDETSEKVIQQSVTSNISQSAVSMIIFDEMDKASHGVLKGIANSLLHFKVDNSYSNATIIVLFISNSLGQKLNSRLFTMLSEGKRREDLQAADFDEVFRPSLMATGDSYSGHRGGYWYDVFTEHGLIDTFVPFLPLNLDHVQQCIHHSLQQRGRTPTVDLVHGITRELSLFQPAGLGIHYSQTGCKRVSEKVDLHSDQPV